MNLSMRFIYAVLVCLSLKCSVLGDEDNSVIRPEEKLTHGLRYPRRTSMMRIQPNYIKSMNFPCSRKNWGPSHKRPTSVHALRPGDIKVIGALGDSLVAANGAMGEYLFEVIFENRGVSWCAGGEKTWREYLTLPNILKEYNPNIKGFSVGTGEYFYKDSHLNIGFPVASILDALMQAKILVKRMQGDPSVDFKNDWKMVTLFFGANDICTLECFNKTAGSPKGFVRSLTKALDYLQDHLPRAFVNIVPVIDITVSVRVKRSLQCRMIHRLYCMCYHMQETDPIEYMAALARGYQKGIDKLINSGRYDRREDFTVVVQPFTKLFNLPSDPKKKLQEVIDVSYITYDCFHFSQKGHALAANLVWNNLLEPIGNKTTKSLDFILQKFNCPTESAPYLFTSKNTRNYLTTGHQ
ncbi:phospholipase B1, membrane-associated-like [Arctopsyche grandis]|uniref:phospholipase B1, membrane-associated-like n=1 Tax=Arctopsyche grandis TaxID=121162 RepID=UPI00406D7E6B